jgi:glycosyltransferase involved in cell wall biosynthesis
MHVVVLVDSLQIGGHSSSLMTFLQRLRREAPSLHVDLVCLESVGPLAGAVPGGVQVGLMPRRVRLRRGRRIAESLVSGSWWPSLAIRLRRRLHSNSAAAAAVMRQNQLYARRRVRLYEPMARPYDLAISWSEGSAFYTLHDKVDADVKIAWIHPDYRQAGFDPAVDREFIDAVDFAVCVSEAGRASLESAFPHAAGRLLVVRNVVDVAKIRRLAREPLDRDRELKGSPFTLVTVCRLHDESKALLRAVEVFRRLRQGGAPVRWIVVGDGPDRERLTSVVEAADLVRDFVLVGSRRNPYPYVALADLFVLPSYYEGMPVAVEEALALGIPTLVTDYASAREQLVDGVEGWIVENSLDAILDKISWIHQHPQELSAVRNHLADRDGGQPCDDYPRLRRVMT